MSGSEDRNMGQVSMRFTSGVSGFITLPGEQEVAISRFNFGYPAVASSLRGLWALTSFGSEGVASEVVNMQLQTPATANGNGLMETADRLFGCEHQIRGNLAGGVLCVKVNNYGQLLRSYYFVYSVNEGEGSSAPMAPAPNRCWWSNACLTRRAWVQASSTRPTHPWTQCPPCCTTSSRTCPSTPHLCQPSRSDALAAGSPQGSAGSCSACRRSTCACRKSSTARVRGGRRSGLPR